MTQNCPRGHRSQGRICRDCGHLFPLAAETGIGPYHFPVLLRSYGHANLYLVREGDRVLLLWEGKVSALPADYARRLDALRAAPAPLLPVLRHFVSDELVYWLQPGFAHRSGRFLDQRLQQGLPEPAQIQRWFGQLLQAQAVLEALGESFHGFASPLLPIGEADLWLSFAPWGDADHHGLRGFVPQGPLPVDRYGLAMVLFHLLTGLSPALWAPDLPRLRSYQYLWGKPVVEFFEALLQRPLPITELQAHWAKISLKLPPEHGPRIDAELQGFHDALLLLLQGQLAQAESRLLELQTPLLHNPHVLSLLGDLNRDRPERAMQAYGESLRREQLGSTWMRVGRWYLAQGIADKASKAFHNASDRLPYDPEPRWQLGAIAFRQQHYIQATTLLQQAQSLRPTPEAARLLNRVALATASASGKLTSDTGFAFTFRQWDQAFEQRHRRFVCPDGHVQEFEARDCLICQRPMHYTAGEKIRDYTVESVLIRRDAGQRHRSSTYRSIAENGQAVLVKEITPDSAGRERHAREARALRLLAGTGFPALLDSFANQERLYLVQNLMPGEDLENLIRQQGPLSESQLWPLLKQALDLLSQLEAAGLVHGDIKPKNLLWDGQRLSLIDFDVSVLLAEQTQCLSPGATAHYAAPEQRLQHLVTPSSDAYSLGLTLIWLLTGLTPELFRYQQAGGGTAYRHWQSYTRVSSGLETLIESLLKPHPEQRPKAEELAALWAVLSAGTPTDSAPQAGLVRAYYAFHGSEDADCLRIAPQLLAQRPDARMHYLIGHELERRGLSGPAQTYLRSAIVMDPIWPYPSWELAGMLCRQGQLDAAREVLEQILGLAGPLPETCRLLAEVLCLLGQSRRALQILAQGLRHVPKDIGLLLEEARALLQLEALEPARTRCEAVLALNPGSARAYQLLQRIAAARLLPQESLRCGHRAIALEPRNPALYFELGQSCYKFRRFAEAIPLLEAALEIEPRLWEAHYFLGTSQLMLGHFAAAELSLVLALRSGKQQDLIQARLKTVREALQRPKLAG